MQLEDFIHIYAAAKSGEIFDPATLAQAEAFAKVAAENPEQAEKWAAMAHWLAAEKIENGK